jgi:hypothetical protein
MPKSNLAPLTGDYAFGKKSGPLVVLLEHAEDFDRGFQPS